MSPPKKTLILHIGTGKTGTTALQEFFWANREELARRGIVYPETGIQSAAHHLLSPHHPPFLLNLGWAFLKPEDWVPQVVQAPTPRILVSSELMASGTDAVVKAFLAALTPVFDVQVVMYLRRQDSAIMAAFNQQVKAGVQIRGMDFFLQRNIERFDYLKLIERWSQHGAQVRVRPFDPRQFHANSLIADFLAGFLGVRDLEGFSGTDATENANPRLSSAALEFKLLINNLIPDIEASARFNDALLAYDAVTEADSKALYASHDTLSAWRQAEIMAQFQDSNRIIDARYLQDHAPYFAVTTDLPPVPGPAPGEAEQKRQRHDRLVDIARWLLQTDPGVAAAARAAAEAITGTEAVRIRSAANQMRQALDQAARQLAAGPPKA